MKKYINSIEFVKKYRIEPWYKSVNPNTKIGQRIERLSYREESSLKDKKRRELGENFHGAVNLTRKELYPKVTYQYLDLFKKGIIEFKEGLNIIVGENGSGKTTLLNIISKFDNNSNVNIKYDIKDLTRKNSFGWDFEIDNPRYNPRMKPNPEESEGFLQKTLNIFSVSDESHGETMKGCLDSFFDIKDSLIIFDEPETALSLISQFEYLHKLRKLAEYNQVIIVTHSKFFIEETEFVFDLDTQKWTSGKKYVAKIKRKAKQKFEYL